jgi:CubicO group peptidase (beta-lactamase class C family)
MRLDDPVHKWLPEFDTGNKKQITIRHLLTHSAGLYQWKPTYYNAQNKAEQYQYISGLPLAWPVGEGRHYSDLGFMLLGDIIEKNTGQPLDEFLQQELYKPLNLQHTVFKPSEKKFSKIAATSHGNPFEKHMVYDDSFGYKVNADPESWDGWRSYTLHGQVNDGNAWYAAGGVAGHAGLFSTADDLQKLITLLLEKGSYQGKQLISPSVIDTFLTKNRYGNAQGWAMAPSVISTQGTPPGTFGHTGFTGTNIAVMPALDLSVIFLTNRQHAGLQDDGYYYDLSALRQQIVDAVLDLQIPERSRNALSLDSTDD